jgi:predicted membrane protein
MQRGQMNVKRNKIVVLVLASLLRPYVYKEASLKASLFHPAFWFIKFYSHQLMHFLLLWKCLAVLHVFILFFSKLTSKL